MTAPSRDSVARLTTGSGLCMAHRNIELLNRAPRPLDFTAF